MELCRRLMAEFWCHKSVSPAPGKDIKERGPGGQDGLERSLRPQQGNPGYSHTNHVRFCLWFVAPSQGSSSGGTSGDRRDKELSRG